VGLPDLHPGKNGPVGAVFAASGMFYPHLIGNDVGCGMALWRTNLACRKLKLDRCEHRLRAAELDRPLEGLSPDIAKFDLDPGPDEETPGTIGGGNHFAELQAIDEVRDNEAFCALGLDAKRLVLLVHSGSRSVGQRLYRSHLHQWGHGSLAEGSDDGRVYLGAHNRAVRWARANRAVIASRVLQALGEDGDRVLDAPHNFLEETVVAGKSLWLHRKGANSANHQPLVIPGSRGTLSYLVIPEGDQSSRLFSLPHGAGRKWARGDCKARLRERYDIESLQRTALDSRVICDDRGLLYEEAPQAYKDIEAVIRVLLELNAIKVIATLRPVITYKTGRVRA